MQNNLILNSDSYKYSHFLQYPEGTKYVSSYIEPRKKNVEIVNFGLQMFIKKYLTQRITKENVDEAESIISAHGEPFNRVGWMDIVRKHDGFLPVSIKALPEGTVLKGSNCQVQIVNTDPSAFWLTSFLETSLLRAVWYPSTVASKSREVKKIIMSFLKDTSDDPDSEINFKLHDFGARGTTSNESAGIGGLSHLVNFMGTDTVMSLVFGKEFYNIDVAGFSIPAAEHSTITSWGKENEVEAYRNMLKKFAKPGSLVAVVSDSYDIYNACFNLWGDILKQEVIDSGATVVIRPDSGDPVEVTDLVIAILSEKFGTTVNSKGYRVLNNVRIIQGDGVNPDSIRAILQNYKSKGWSASNIAFGMGAGLLQNWNRDTYDYAMKTNAIYRNGEWHNVYKKPVDGSKPSKSGRLAVVMEHGDLITTKLDNIHGRDDMLVEVFRNGRLIIDENFDKIRSRAKI